MWIVSWDPFLMKKLFKSEICWSVNSAWCALINWNCLTSQTLRQLFMYSAWTVSVTVKFVPKCVKKKKEQKNTNADANAGPKRSLTCFLCIYFAICFQLWRVLFAATTDEKRRTSQLRWTSRSQFSQADRILWSEYLFSCLLPFFFW